MRKILFILLFSFQILYSQTSSAPALPQEWERISIENVGSFDIPPTMKLMTGAYTDSKSNSIRTVRPRQREFELRVIPSRLSGFQYIGVATIEFTTLRQDHTDETLSFDINNYYTRDEIADMNNSLREGTVENISMMSNKGRLYQWTPLKLVRINNMSCYHLNYKIQFDYNKSIVHFNQYMFSNYDYMHVLIIAYDEKVKNDWDDDLKTVINSLRLVRRR
jgi:hypothetical protein